MILGLPRVSEHEKDRAMAEEGGKQSKREREMPSQVVRVGAMVSRELHPLI